MQKGSRLSITNEVHSTDIGMQEGSKSIITFDVGSRLEGKGCGESITCDLACGLEGKIGSHDSSTC